MLDLSVIVVSWNVRDLLRRCLQSIERSLDGNFSAEIIVVDNSSSDGSAAMVRSEFPQVRLIETGANLGYSGGVNAGLRVACGRFLCVLNPDTEIVGDALPTLVRYMQAHPEVAVVGPQLRYPDGTIQSSRRRLPSPMMALWESTILATWWPDNPWGRRFRMEDLPDNREQPVEWLVGAALLVRREDIERAGPMDERFWMFSEELEWQRRLGAGGRRIVYLPQAQIIHHEGQSTAQVPARKHLAFQQSKLRYIAQTHGRGAALLLRCILLLGYAVELATEVLKWALGHKRPLRRERMRTYVAVLRGLLRG